MERPRPIRPAFLSDVKSMRHILQEQNIGGDKIALDALAKESKTGIVSPSAADPTLIDLTALRQRFNIDSKLSEMSPTRLPAMTP